MRNYNHPDICDCDSVLAEILSAHKPTTLNRITSFREVASVIFPPQNYRGGSRYSMRRLRHFIATDPEILDRMRAAGYSPSKPYLTSRQMRILADYV